LSSYSFKKIFKVGLPPLIPRSKIKTFTRAAGLVISLLSFLVTQYRIRKTYLLKSERSYFLGFIACRGMFVWVMKKGKSFISFPDFVLSSRISEVQDLVKVNKLLIWEEMGNWVMIVHVQSGICRP